MDRQGRGGFRERQRGGGGRRVSTNVSQCWDALLQSTHARKVRHDWHVDISQDAGTHCKEKEERDFCYNSYVEIGEAKEWYEATRPAGTVTSPRFRRAGERIEFVCGGGVFLSKAPCRDGGLE